MKVSIKIQVRERQKTIQGCFALGLLSREERTAVSNMLWMTWRALVHYGGIVEMRDGLAVLVHSDGIEDYPECPSLLDVPPPLAHEL